MKANFRSFGPASADRVRRISATTWDPARYGDRAGYRPDFVDSDGPVPLPGLGRWVDDVAPLIGDVAGPGADPAELKYTHFSVKVSRSRRLPLFSAVNIDGSHSDRETERTDVWRLDPRIEARYQIIRDVYGNDRDGFFSRGHMTRREDPNWGNETTTKAADADTFHVTNAAPQRQRFNAGLWLDLEDYVLSNTDRDNLPVSVITGPVFGDDDPDYYGVRVPIAYWKIVVFKHVATRKLTAIAYKRSQATFLLTRTRGKFTFSDFDDTQVGIGGLAEETGLDLSTLAEIDVLARADSRIAIALRNVGDAFLTA